jgi:hypothetical protein
MTRAEKAWRIAVPVVLGWAVLVLGGCSRDELAADNDPAEPGTQSPETPTAAESPVWSEFTSVEGRFRVLFPNEPQVERGDRPNETTLQAAAGASTCAVYYVDLPDFDRATTSREMVVDDARTTFIAELHARQLSQEETTIEGHPGQAYRVEIPSQKAVGEYRVLMADKRVYRLSVIGPRDGFDNGQAEKFFGSFALVAQE